MKEIKAIIQPFRVDEVLHALAALPGLPGVTLSQVVGWGKTRASDAESTVTVGEHALAPKTKLEIVVSDVVAERVIGAIEAAARTSNLGDGKIFVSDVGEAVKIRTGERGEGAL